MTILQIHQVKKLLIIFFLFNTAFAQKQLCVLELTNRLPSGRKQSVIEIPFDRLKQKLGNVSFNNIVIRDQQNREVVYQWVKEGKDEPLYLLVQTDVPADKTVSLKIMQGKPGVFKPKTYARFVPERFDDFAWENDRIAFRMYGPALQGRFDNAYGIDIWSKRTTALVLNKWYKRDYHKDEGEGLDYYHVGLTLGAGDIAPFIDDSIYFSNNYASYKILENGPLRCCFELTYNSWKAGASQVEAVKKISLDAGSQLNRTVITYKITGADSLPVVTGIVKRPKPGIVHLDENQGIMNYWEPREGESGTMGLACISMDSASSMMVGKGHLITRSVIYNNKPFTYYDGGAWDKAGIILSSSDWIKYLEDFKQQLSNPVLVTVK
jgi:hypothetical protein